MEIWKEAEGTELVCHVMRMNSDSKALFHWHENYELCQPLNRGCRFLVDGKPVQAGAGDLVSIDRQVIHRFLPEQADTHIRVLQFPIRILLQSGITAGTLQTHIPRQAMEAVPGLWQAVTTLMELMEQEPRVFTGQKNMLLQSLMASLYFLLLKHFPAEQDRKSRKDADLFFQAAEYANSHFDEEDSTVEVMAKKLCVSREKLSAVFLQYAGIPLKHYIHTLRTNYVNQLLLQGCDITTAALKSGFGSIRTFNNVYKTVMGITPTEYLKAYERNEKQPRRADLNKELSQNE